MTDNDYLTLTKKLTQLRERSAVLIAQEQDRARERAAIEEELRAAGVDTSRLEDEMKRLEREINIADAEILAAVDLFERELTEATKPRLQTAPTGDPADVNIG